MTGLIITIAQRKGGSGKTTLAAQLSVAWARGGERVAALDTDPQGSFAAWVSKVKNDRALSEPLAPQSKPKPKRGSRFARRDWC
jgi:cellulose biosynthesis protein BcsQ